MGAGLMPVGNAGYRAGDCLRHWITLCMLVLWVLNDHVFKALLGNPWTGKLSDVTGLAVFPLIPYAAYEMLCALRGVNPRLRQGILLASLLATGAVMTGINLFDPWADAFRFGLGAAQWPFRSLWQLAEGGAMPPLMPVHHTMDPTDLWALPALGIPYWVVNGRGGTDRRASSQPDDGEIALSLPEPGSVTSRPVAAR